MHSVFIPTTRILKISIHILGQYCMLYSNCLQYMLSCFIFYLNWIWKLRSCCSSFDFILSLKQFYSMLLSQIKWGFTAVTWRHFGYLVVEYFHHNTYVNAKYDITDQIVFCLKSQKHIDHCRTQNRTMNKIDITYAFCFHFNYKNTLNIHSHSWTILHAFILWWIYFMN